MSAVLPPTQREPIPRVVTARPSSSVAAATNGGDLRIYSNANRSLRYQYLPDYDSSETDEQITAKLNERFEILREMTKESIEGRIRAMIASGPGGVGKTYTIDEELAKLGDSSDYTSHSGYSTPVGLFRMLYKHREEGQLIKLDDIDSVFNEEKSLNFIKTACDTTSKRIISNNTEAIFIDEDSSEPIPRSFEFNGTMMFCTNLDFDALIDKGNKLSPHLEALITRSHYIDLGMRTKRDYLIRVFMVAETGLFDNVQGGKLTEEEENDVLEFIDTNFKILRECSLRMALKLGSLRRAWTPDEAIHWKRKALLTCCRNVR